MKLFIQLEQISSPWLTEVMQWVYTSYWLFPLATLVLVARRQPPALLVRALFSVVASLFLCYVGFYLVPASGPNIHNNFGPLHATHVDPLPLYHFDSSLPGLWATAWLRELMFTVERTKFTCFPSGHVAATVVCMVLARRVGGWSSGILQALGLGIVFSTVYLRYHYVIDVVAGAAVAWLCVGLVERGHRAWERTYWR